MARKRGGLAGLYDRNKGTFRIGAQLAGSAIGGMLGGPGGAKIGGSLAGAAVRGLDREGKRGIGFDVGQGALGGIEGYGVAKGATAAKSMLTGARAAGARAAGATAGEIEEVLRKNASTGTGGAGTLTQLARDLFGLAKQQGGKAFGSSEILGGIAKGLYGERKDLRDAALVREKLAEERRQFDASLGLKTREADIATAQEADRKRREEELMKARATIRAMFGGA